MRVEKQMRLKMKKQVLMIRNGEFERTLTPFKDPSKLSKSELNELLSKKVDKIISNDNWMIVTVPKYEMEEIDIPSWLSVDEYIKKHITWKYFLYMFKDNGENDEKLARKFFPNHDYSRFCIVKLYQSNPRTKYKRSLKNQVEQWIEDDDTKFDLPLSPKQIKSLDNKWDRLKWQRTYR